MIGNFHDVKRKCAAFEQQLENMKNSGTFWLLAPVTCMFQQCSVFFIRKNVLALATSHSQTIFIIRFYNISDGRVVRASASGAVNAGWIPSRVKPVTLKLVFIAFLLDAQY